MDICADKCPECFFPSECSSGIAHQNGSVWGAIELALMTTNIVFSALDGNDVKKHFTMLVSEKFRIFSDIFLLTTGIYDTIGFSKRRLCESL